MSKLLEPATKILVEFKQVCSIELHQEGKEEDESSRQDEEAESDNMYVWGNCLVTDVWI